MAHTAIICTDEPLQTRSLRGSGRFWPLYAVWVSTRKRVVWTTRCWVVLGGTANYVF